MAAAAIYIVSQLSKSKNYFALSDIASVSGISEITIRSTYKAMFPYKKEIIDYLVQTNIKIKSAEDFKRPITT